MKISPRSWHYRVMTWDGHLWHGHPKSLCEYFWSVVISGIVGICFIVIWAPIWIPFLALIKVLTWLSRRVAWDYARSVYLILTDRASETFKKPNILVEFWKAQKRKVCLVIKWDLVNGEWIGTFQSGGDVGNE